MQQADKDKPKQVKSTPSISAIADAYTANGAAKTFAFTISDADSNLSCVSSVSIQSSLPTVTPATGMLSTGTAPSCTLTITPAPGQSGIAAITVTVSNGTNSAAAHFNLNVTGTLGITGTPVLTALENTAYTGFTVTGSGGLAPLTYSVAAGALPAGVTLNSSTGVVSGTPTATGNFTGIQLRVTDALGATADLATFTLSVASYAWDFTAAASLDAGITYTRSGGGTRTSATGGVETLAYNVPRFEYDSAGAGTLRGLLVEETSANLLFMTERFDHTAWTKTRSTVTANAAVAPDGNSTADKLVEDATAGNTHLVQGANITKAASSITYTMSVFAKAAERSAITLWLYGASTANRVATTCTLSGAGSVGSTAAAGTFSGASAAVTKLANGWYRCSVTGTSDTATSVRGEFHLNNGASDTYNGDAASGAYLWGAQIEATAVPTSYIPNSNLFLYSEQLDQAGSWVVSTTTISADGASAPDGTVSADGVVDASAAAAGYVRQNVTVLNDSLTYVTSVYVKQAVSGVVAVYAGLSGGTTAVTNAVAVDLSTGNYSVANVGAAPASCTVTSENGYWRVSFPISNNTSGNTTFQVRLYPAYAAALAGAGLGFTTNAANASTGTAYFWGAQLEVASSASPYVRKTTNAVRGQDSVNVTALGAWFEPTEGTMVSEFALPATSGTGLNPAVASFSDGTSGNRITQYLSSTGAGVDVYTGAVQQTAATVTAGLSATSKVATVYKYNDLQAALNNTLGTGTASASMPTVSRLTFGQYGNNSNFLDGIFRKLTYFPVRVPSTLLQSLSQ